MNKEQKEIIRELAEEGQKLEEIIEELSRWKKAFPNQTPQQVKSKLEGYSSQQLEGRLASRNWQNNFKNANRKKESKLCEICSQFRQDNFKYSRISSRGFNTNRIYRICSFCQKTVQLIVENY